ncbi:MAG: type IVB secretion system protein IcmH/DotU [Methylococcales bacterium]
MSNDDPFGNSYIDDDKTILRPMPGGRKSQASSASMPSPNPGFPPANARISENLREACAAATSNPIVGAAISLLSVVAQLRNTAQHPDIEGLRASVIEEIKQFEVKVKRQRMVASEQLQAARYALCTLLDETVLNTPWGSNSLWSTNSMLVFFHRENWGGEKFFLILKNCMQQPGTHLDLLELLYFCLCLGFEGRYRVEDHGLSKLEDIRENAYQIIQRQRGDVDRNLSLHWQGIKDKRNILTKLVPLWVIGSVASLLLMLIYLCFLYFVNLASNPLLAKLYSLKDSFNVQPMVAEVIPNTEVQVNSRFDALNAFLKPEVEHGEVTLLQKEGKTIIRIISKGLFASGSDKVMSDYESLLDRISLAISTVSDRVLVVDHILVVGHTDSVPIFSARFPSNWALSKARALSVVKRLADNNKAPIDIEGRADTQPLAPNDSAEHKAKNRRIEIILG